MQEARTREDLEGPETPDRVVSPAQAGQASGTNNAIREVGGVFGVAVLASIFTRYGGYESSATFTDGLVVATWVGAAVVGLGALVALAIPRRPSADAVAAGDDARELVGELEAA